MVEITGGSVTGRDHIIIGKPNQDAYNWIQTDDFVIATICDGCGSSKHSEVGAKLGVTLFNNLLQYNLYRFNILNANNIQSFVKNSYDCMCTSVDTLNLYISDIVFRMNTSDISRSSIINNYFLFTIVTTIITKKYNIIFIIGDGVYQINNYTPNIIDSNNIPNYPIYKILGKPFEVIERYFSNYNDYEFILIGSDGCNDLIRSANENIPGKDEKVNTLYQFYNDKYYKNPDIVRRRLAQINKTTQKIDWEKKEIISHHGHLKDDTTLICIRRKV